MISKGSITSWFLRVTAIAVTAGLIYSCSNAEPNAQKNAASDKANASSVKPAAKSGASDTIQKEVPEENRHIVVYYLHGNARCPTCFKLETFAKSEVEADFADAIKKGTLEWKTINIEEKGNEHFGQDYKLYTKSVIISTRLGDKETSWKNLDQIWQLVHEEGKYREYIRNEVKACLDGKCL